MPTISVEQRVLEALMSDAGHVHNVASLEEQLPLLGTDIDRCDEVTLDIEIFPDRPDLLSAETLARAMRSFLHDEAVSPGLSVEPATTTMTVDAELANVRPVILCAMVHGVNLGESEEAKDASIRRLMDHQEKLHFAIGRGRHRASIGVHDLDRVQAPFRAVCMGRDASFVPLGSEDPMSIDTILSEHPKGVAYAHLLDGMERVPLLLDANDAVLSFPPIINGTHTTVTTSTTSMLVDVTGWDVAACEASLHLICLQLEAMGGTVQQVEIVGGPAEGSHPVGAPVHHRLPKDLVQRLLGRTFTQEEATKAFRRMGGEVLEATEDTYVVAMPRWRLDVLHHVDLIEDLAIGHGYDDLGTATPTAPAHGQPRHDAHLRRRVRTALVGLGFTEVQSLTLSNHDDQFTRMRWTPSGDVTEITNPITVDHTVLRQHLLPGLLRLLAANRHHDLPQAVFELGTVVRDHHNAGRVAFLAAEASGGFAAIRGRIQAFMGALGATEATNVQIEPLPDGEGPWLAGRAARVLVNGAWVGCFGEIDPHVGDAFELAVPMNAAEFDMNALDAALPDPV